MGYYVRVEQNVKIYVEDLNPEGEKTIVFLHGWPANQRMFEYQFNQLPKLGFRCIGIDSRGFGQSDKPWHGYDYNQLADDTRCVMEELNLCDVTLGGHSTGGAIAVRYMARHNGFGVSKLSLWAAAAPSLIQRPYFPYGLEKSAVDQIIEGTYKDRPKMLQNFGDMFFFQYKTEAFKEWFFQMGLEAAGWATAAVAETWLEDEGLFADLEAIRVPTLILHGIHDQVCLFPLAQAQHKLLANSRLIPFKYSGHGLMFDQQDQFNKELAEFAGA